MTNKFICRKCASHFSSDDFIYTTCPNCNSSNVSMRWAEFVPVKSEEEVEVNVPSARFLGLESLEGKIPTLNDHPNARTEGAFFAAEYFLQLAEKFGLDIAKAELKTEQAKENLRQCWETWSRQQS